MIPIASLLMIFGVALFIAALILYAYILYKHKKLMKHIFYHKEELALLEEQKKERFREFQKKLTQAGLTLKSFYEIVALSLVAACALIFLAFFLHTSIAIKTLLIVVGIGVAIFMPFLYVDEQKKARIKRIEKDLAIFIDLLIIILEGGGGLNNAIDKVTVEASSILGKDLLEESKLFKYEFLTYGSEVAYNNLIERTGSDAIATIVGFMRLSQETGIGVKTVFENQSEEIKASEMLNIEKKAATINISITFIMFIFILPAVIAMVAFPLASGALMKLF